MAQLPLGPAHLVSGPRDLESVRDIDNFQT